jgi:DDE superfamily endonuclease
MSQPPEDGIITTHPVGPPLLAELRRLFSAHRPAFCQKRPFRRMQALLFGQLFCFARRTVTQALVALSLTNHDWSAFYRLFNEPRIDYEQLTGCFLRETLDHTPTNDPYVAVVDGVQVPRHSHKMPGTSWLKNPRTPPFMPGPHRAQRFLHLAALLPRTEEGYSRALPLRWEPAFPEKAVLPEGVEPRKQWEAALEGIHWLREQLDQAGRTSRRLLVVGDGEFSVAKLRASLPERTAVFSRCARNRALYALPNNEEGRRGRRRKYGEKARKPHEWLTERSGWRQAEFMVRGRLVRPRYRIEGPFVLEGAADRPVFLMVVKGVHRRSRGRRRHRNPSFFLVCTESDSACWALPFSAEVLLGWAFQRWEVEVAHRELKASCGLGEIQCWSKHAAILAVQWQAWAYGALVLAGYRAWGLGKGPIRPPGRWWNGSGRWSLGTLWRGYRAELWGLEEFQPTFIWTTDGWPEKEGLLAGMGNTVNGSLRG